MSASQDTRAGWWADWCSRIAIRKSGATRSQWVDMWGLIKSWSIASHISPTKVIDKEKEKVWLVGTSCSSGSQTDENENRSQSHEVIVSVKYFINYVSWKLRTIHKKSLDRVVDYRRKPTSTKCSLHFSHLPSTLVSRQSSPRLYSDRSIFDPKKPEKNLTTSWVVWT